MKKADQSTEQKFEITLSSVYDPTIPQSSFQLRDELVTQANNVPKPTNADELQIAVANYQNLKRLAKTVEETRKLVKAPVLKKAADIDTIAENFLANVEAAMIRLNGDPKSGKKGIIGIFQEEELQRQRDEQKRLDDAAAEATRVAQEAIAEQTRLANLKRPSPAKEAAAEQKVIEAVEQVQVAQAAVAAPVAKAAGLKPKMIPQWEVTDAKALYAVRPEFFDLVEKKSAMKAVITKDTQLPGLRVWEVLDTKIRA